MPQCWSKWWVRSIHQLPIFCSNQNQSLLLLPFHHSNESRNCLVSRLYELNKEKFIYVYLYTKQIPTISKAYLRKRQGSTDFKEVKELNSRPNGIVCLHCTQNLVVCARIPENRVGTKGFCTPN